MEVDVVVERERPGEASRTEPRNRVTADGEKDQSHVELESLCSALGCGQAVPHHLERVHVSVVNELPSEEPHHDRNPQCNHPQSLPVLFQVVAHFSTEFPDGPSCSQAC